MPNHHRERGGHACLSVTSEVTGIIIPVPTPICPLTPGRAPRQSPATPSVATMWRMTATLPLCVLPLVCNRVCEDIVEA